MEVGTMTAQIQGAGSVDTAPATPSNVMPERMARFLPGIPMLVLGIALLIAAVVAFWQAGQHPGGTALALAWAGAPLLPAGVFTLRRLTPAPPPPPPPVQPFPPYLGPL